MITAEHTHVFPRLLDLAYPSIERGNERWRIECRVGAWGVAPDGLGLGTGTL